MFFIQINSTVISGKKIKTRSPVLSKLKCIHVKEPTAIDLMLYSPLTGFANIWSFATRQQTGLQMTLYISCRSQSIYLVKNPLKQRDDQLPALLAWSKPENSVRTILTIGERRRTDRIRHQRASYHYKRSFQNFECHLFSLWITRQIRDNPSLLYILTKRTFQRILLIAKMSRYACKHASCI